MSSTQPRKSSPSAVSDEARFGATIFVLALVVVAGAWTALHLGAKFADQPAPPSNPIEIIKRLATGAMEWPAAATKVAIGEGVIVALLLIGLFVLLWRRASSAKKIDRAARHMATPAELQPRLRKGASRTAARLGVTAGAGLTLATLLVGRGRPGPVLYRGWEDVITVIAGPRVGKTSAFVIPEILAAPGAVLATSNKRDVVDATRDPRGGVGDVWVFDPQGLVDEPLTWWWNPLTYVTNEVKAEMLADAFATASGESAAGASTDSGFFPHHGRLLLAALLLAAAVDRRELGQVHRWLADPDDDEPVQILTRNGYPASATSLRGELNSPSEQRGGVVGTAQGYTSFMTNRQAMAWVTPPDAGMVREFDPHSFVATKDTLYSLSKEGKGTAGPLVTALTIAVCEAAEDLAKNQASGRLVVPMLVSLDEAANVCRWRELPNLYSHYGSRGILISTYLQSWSQGVEVWGREGMRKLWSASTIKVFAGGVSEVDFLREISQLIGDHRVATGSVSRSRQGRSVTSGDERSENVLDVADLGSLPTGRAVVIASGSRPALAKTHPWMDGPHRDAIKASLANHQHAGPT